MSEFEKWLEENYPIAGLDMCEKEGDRYTHKPTRNMHDAYLAGQQSKEAAIQEMDEVIKLQDADLRKYEKQIESLKEHLNNMEACYIEKKKQVEECAALAAGWNEIAWDKTTHWTEGYEEGCYHCSAQIEEALRGGS